jgi:hypothetical protein
VCFAWRDAERVQAESLLWIVVTVVTASILLKVWDALRLKKGLSASLGVEYGCTVSTKLIFPGDQGAVVYLLGW